MNSVLQFEDIFSPIYNSSSPKDHK